MRTLPRAWSINLHIYKVDRTYGDFLTSSCCSVLQKGTEVYFFLWIRMSWAFCRGTVGAMCLPQAQYGCTLRFQYIFLCSRSTSCSLRVGVWIRIRKVLRSVPTRQSAGVFTEFSTQIYVFDKLTPGNLV